MKKRLISFVFAVCSIVLLLTVSVFATEVLSEEEPWKDVSDYYGDSKVASGSGIDHSTCTSESGCEYCQGYDNGYYDGAHAGYDSGYTAGVSDKDEAVAEQTANILNEFLESEEFKALLQSAKDSAVQDYKDNEGQDLIDAAFDEGHESGYNSGYDSGVATNEYIYRKGYADGQANFRGSELYATELTEYFKNGFYLAYDDAYVDGYNEGVKYQINPGQLVVLALALLFIAVLFVIFSIVMYKTKKKRKVRRK